jgi:MSHA biogenesis protein MshK
MRLQKWICAFVIAILYSGMSFAELRDPTRPADYVDTGVESVSALELNAVMISPNRKIAIINGQIVKIGDEVSGSKVTSIEQNYVELEGADTKMTLFLLTTPVKKPTVHK